MKDIEKDMEKYEFKKPSTKLFREMDAGESLILNLYHGKLNGADRLSSSYSHKIVFRIGGKYRFIQILITDSNLETQKAILCTCIENAPPKNAISL